MIEEPELVTLIPEEEDPPPPLSPELRVIRQVVIDVAVLVVLKVAMVFATRRVYKSVRELNKTDIPHQWYRD